MSSPDLWRYDQGYNYSWLFPEARAEIAKLLRNRGIATDILMDKSQDDLTSHNQHPLHPNLR